jgi:hypothetical protein
VFSSGRVQPTRSSRMLWGQNRNVLDGETARITDFVLAPGTMDRVWSVLPPGIETIHQSERVRTGFTR